MVVVVVVVCLCCKIKFLLPGVTTHHPLLAGHHRCNHMISIRLCVSFKIRSHLHLVLSIEIGHHIDCETNLQSDNVKVIQV